MYADDARGDASDAQRLRARTPYTVTEQNFSVRSLQPRGGHRHAVFHIHAREALSYHYERNPSDPRIQHTLTLEVDDHGNVVKQAAIAYGRRTSVRVVDAQGHAQQLPNPGLATLPAADRPKQTTTLVTYTEHRLTNAVESVDSHRNPLACEVVTYELTGYVASGPAGRYEPADLVEPDPAVPERLRHRFTDDVAYEDTPTANPCRRPIEWLRTLYRRDDLNGLSPLGQLHALGLPGESYKLAFTPGLLAQVFQRPRAGQAPEALLPVPATVLGGQSGDRGGYLQSQQLKADGRFPASDPDDHWWVPSGVSFFTTNPGDPSASELSYARQHFFLGRRYRDPFGHNAFVDFDANDLLIGETRDALDNRVTVIANDYRVLQPRLVSDANGNQAAVAFDTLGMVAGTAAMGKPLPAPVEGDTLDGFVAELTQVQRDAFFDAADPRVAAPALLQSATTRVIYDLDRFRRTRRANPNDPALWQPVCAATLARETHASAALPLHGLRIQVACSFSDGVGREIQKKVQAEPGPVASGGPAVNPRWVGTGWTIFNNKGKPVRQFEPFFSASHTFEFGVQVGVSANLFYDPVERVVATLHPDHTFGKVVFDPWQQTTYDVNDTCAPRNAQTGDPRTDPDIGGYVASYFASLPASPPAPAWETWHAQRVAGALGPHAQAAATRAAAHADTPTTAHVDPLGRPFLTVARNRLICVGHDLDGTEAGIATRVDLDIEGNQRVVRDEREAPIGALPVGAMEQRVIMRYHYDMLGNQVQQVSMEAGARWMLNDASGKPVRAWDSRGHNITTTYDALRRPVEQFVRGTTPDSDPRTLNQDVLVDTIEYGEGLVNASALNLRTRIYRHFDSAGVEIAARLDANDIPTEAFDFKGNQLHSTRRLVSDYAAIPDWRLNPPLDLESFESSTRYDALSRPIQSIAPHSTSTGGGRNVTQATFNEANLLERVDVWLNRAAAPASLLDPQADLPSAVGVSNIDYDAKGRRERVDYKNGVSTLYSYDPLTFRLTQLLTRRNAVAWPGDDPQPPIVGWPGHQVQNLHYTYDPTGNITHIHDAAQQTIYFRNKRVEPSNDYTYDALYRLIQAAGREHLGQGGAPGPHSHDDAGRVGIVSADAAGRFAPNDGNAMGTYIERYVYDAAGNILQMQHRGSDPPHAGWTRAYDYAEASLIEDGSAGSVSRTSNRLTRTVLNPGGVSATLEPYEHDAHGNIVRMPHLGSGQAGPNMLWGYNDRLQRVDRGSGAAFYVYDAGGERIRKVWEKSPGLIEERIYLGTVEIFRRHGGPIGPNTAALERETLHVMDDSRRVAIVETRTRDSAGNDPAPGQLIRYQHGNHLGSASLELDHEARIVSYEEYSPYGSATYQAVRSQTDTPKRYRYTGKERDEESGFSYHSARYCAVWLGRWTAADPIGLKDGHNLYEFVSANPVMVSDSSGLGFWGDVWGGIKSAGRGLVEPVLLGADLVRMGGTAIYHEAKEAITGEEYPVEFNFWSGTGNRMAKAADKGDTWGVWRAAGVFATAMPTGGATVLVDNIATVFENDMTPEQAQSFLTQSAVAQVVSTGVGAGTAKATGQGWTGRNNSPTTVPGPSASEINAAVNVEGSSNVMVQIPADPAMTTNTSSYGSGQMVKIHTQAKTSAPGNTGNVKSTVRFHDADSSAPQGSVSRQQTTMSIEQAGGGRRVVPDNASPWGGRWIYKQSASSADWGAAHIPLFKDAGGSTPFVPSLILLPIPMRQDPGDRSQPWMIMMGGSF